jgi:hypothetical protein
VKKIKNLAPAAIEPGAVQPVARLYTYPAVPALKMLTKIKNNGAKFSY